MKSQKESVIEEVMLSIPSFVQGSDIALSMLTDSQLENIKANIMNGIINKTIEYGKDPNNYSEVRSYARSMVMNWLKKAKELNGGNSIGKTSNSATNSSNSGTRISKQRAGSSFATSPKGINIDILPVELQEYVKTLV